MTKSMWKLYSLGGGGGIDCMLGGRGELEAVMVV